MINPKLSIITVNLNNSEGLKKTIDSVVCQSFIDFEYIIIDGGSTDSSVEVIKKNAEKISCWVSEPDKGIYNAMNKGILKATGEYCLFLNSGDWLVSSDTLREVFQVPPTTDIVYGNLLKVKGKEIVRDRGIANSNITFFDLYKGTINHPASFIRRSILHKTGLYNESLKIVGDWSFFLQAVVLNGASVLYIDKDIAYFDMNGVSERMQEKIKTEREATLKELIPGAILADYDNLLIGLTKFGLKNRFFKKILLIVFRLTKIFSKR